MPARCRFALAFLLAVAPLAVPPPAAAQTDAALSLGLSLGVRAPTSESADADIGPGLVLRFRGDDGIGPSIGFNWFSTTVTTTVGGRATRLGRIDIKPVMAGVSYGRDVSRFRGDVSLEGGLAFTHARATGELKDAYAGLGVTAVGVSVSNAFAWRGQFTAWYDLAPRWAVMASVGYLGIRPTVTTTSSAGSTREKMNLGSVVGSVGFAYGIF